MQVNNSPSFKAQFKISEQTDQSFTYEALKKALTKPAQGGKDLLDFMAYIYSDEGKAQLNKLPKEDTVELLLFEEHEKNEDKAVLKPYLYYDSKSMPLSQRVDFECQGMSGLYSNPCCLQRQFIIWSDNIVKFLKQK